MDIFKLTTREPTEKIFRLTGEQFEVIWKRFIEQVHAQGGMPLTQDLLELKKMFWRATLNK